MLPDFFDKEKDVTLRKKFTEKSAISVDFQRSFEAAGSLFKKEKIICSEKRLQSCKHPQTNFQRFFEKRQTFTNLQKSPTLFHIFAKNIKKII